MKKPVLKYLTGIAAYTPATLRADALAALNVAIIGIPQGMAYALIAGVPPVYGLYTSVASAIVGALMGSSRHLITGPTNASALIFAATLATAYSGAPPIHAVFFYTLIIGVVKLLFGVLRLGELVYYISDSVIIGFLAGAGLLILGNQLAPSIGVHPPEEIAHDFVRRVVYTIGHFGDANLYALTIALCTAVAVYALSHWTPRIPAALLTTGGAALVVAISGLGEHVETAGDLGSITRWMLPFQMVQPDFAMAPALLSSAVAVAVIGLMEVTAISKSIAVSSGQRIDSNREFVGQGMANIIGSFFQNYASSGSLTRSVLNYQSGAKSRLSGALSGVLIALAVALLGPFAAYIPIPALAGLLMVVAIQMIKVDQIHIALHTGWQSATIMVITFFATLFLRIDLAIYLGVVISLIFFIRESSHTRVTLLVPTREGRFREVSLDETNAESLRGEVAILNIIGSLCFGALDDMLSDTKAVLAARPRAVVLRMRRIITIDASTIAGLQKLHGNLEEAGIPFIICGVDDRLYRNLRNAGIVALVGSERIIRSNDLLFNSMEATLELADRLSGKHTPRGRSRDAIEWYI